MSFALLEAVEGLEISNEEEFRQKVCGRCKWKEICALWEFDTVRTLYSNINAKSGEPLKSHSGKVVGVFRCSGFDHAGEQ